MIYKALVAPEALPIQDREAGFQVQVPCLMWWHPPLSSSNIISGFGVMPCCCYLSGAISHLVTMAWHILCWDFVPH